MPPEIPILAQSDSKSKFLERLGLSDHTEEGKRIYALMKEEAVAGRARMSANPASLLPHLINDPSVKPPYSNTQISEMAMHDETLAIFRRARTETRQYYEKGHYFEGNNEENWIIKWLLWHVFRYRDSRNRNRMAASASNRGSVTPEASVATAGGILPPLQLLPPIRSWSPTSGPASPGYLTPHSAPEHIQMEHHYETDDPLNPTDRPPSRRSQSQGYWDPVRETHRPSR